jgi:peptidoglycan/xylan/chitin deacetylase (PgdA/CDA1 family)
LLAALRNLAVLPARRVFGTVIRVETSEPVVALTFDDGPHPLYLPRLLQLLDRYRARATFFVIGDKAQRYPELISQLAQSGHVVGNHSFSHPSLPTLDSAARRREIRACAAAIAPHGSRLLRPPYGHQSLASRLDALRCGYQVIGWNVDVWDWQYKTPQWMAAELEHRTKSGDILLLHDAVDTHGNPELNEDRSDMLLALEQFLERTKDRFRCVTVPELLRAGCPVRVNWLRQKRNRTY